MTTVAFSFLANKIGGNQQAAKNREISATDLYA
jgi:hypothetical protein